MRPPRPVYSDADKRAALELAAAVGRRAAIRQLGISSSTFQRWTEELPELWSSLRAGDRDAQRLGFAQRLEDLAESYTAAEFEALERAEKLLPKANAKELAALMKAMGASRGLATVGARAARGEDAERHEITIDFPQIEAVMERLLGGAPEQPALTVPNEAVKELQ